MTDPIIYKKSATIKLGAHLSPGQKKAVTALLNDTNIRYFNVVFDTLLNNPRLSDMELLYLKEAGNFIEEIARKTKRKKHRLNLNVDNEISQKNAYYLTCLFNAIKCCFDNVTSEHFEVINKLNVDVRHIVQKSADFIEALSEESPTYQIKVQEDQKEQEYLTQAIQSCHQEIVATAVLPTYSEKESNNATAERVISFTKEEEILTNTLLIALNSNNAGSSTILPSNTVQIIKRALGASLFDQLVAKYGINATTTGISLENNYFNFDDLRMIIIGALQNCGTNWEKNPFIQTLLMCCNSAHHSTFKGNEQVFLYNYNEFQKKIKSCVSNDEKQVLFAQTIKKIQINPQVWDELKKVPRSGIINQGLHEIGKIVDDKWKFLIPIRFKNNSSFLRDLDTVTSVCNVDDWKKITDQSLKPFVSTEFVFHKLSNTAWGDGAVIPIIEPDGSENFYKVKNLTDAPISSFALIPLNPETSKEIKVVFNNKKNLATQIIDLEQHLPMQHFKKHRDTLMQKLDQVVGEFKGNLDVSKQQDITLNIGGHGAGGTLAQLLTSELINNKAAAYYNDTTNFKDEIENNIKNQINYELSQGKQLSSEKSDVFLQMLAENHSKKIGTNLLNIKKFNLSTVNSAGVSKEIRNNFLQSLHLLKKKEGFHIECKKIMNAHDPVQITGETDLAAYVNPEHMKIKLAAIGVPEEKKFKPFFKNIIKSAAILVAQVVLSSNAIIAPPLIAPVVASFLAGAGTPKENLENIVDNIKSIIKIAKNAHNELHFNVDSNEFTKNCQIMSNDTADLKLNEHQNLNHMVSKKAAILSSAPYKKFKAICSNIGGFIKNNFVESSHKRAEACVFSKAKNTAEVSATPKDLGIAPLMDSPNVTPDPHR